MHKLIKTRLSFRSICVVYRAWIPRICLAATYIPCKNNYTMTAESENPFADLKIDSHESLHKVTSRTKCPQCSASRKYFCYKCCLPMQSIEGTYKTVTLPLKVDIIKHHLELEGKSTAVHARLIAPDHVTIYTYPEIPQYVDKSKILLVFPYKDAIRLEDLVSSTATNETKGVQSHIPSTDSAKNSPSERDSKHSTLEQNDTGTDNSCLELNAGCMCSSTLRTQFKSCGCRVEKDGKTSQSLASVVSESRNGPTGDPEELSSGETASRFCHQNDTHSPLPGNHTKSHQCDNRDILLRTVKDVEVDSQEHLSKRIRHDQEPCLFDRVIFIDSTWNQCGVISRDKRLEGIQRVILQDRETAFWRSQPGKPRTYLATIEAIHYFLVDYHRIVLRRSYSGQYDNLLYFYSFMHELVKKAQKEKDSVEEKT